MQVRSGGIEDLLKVLAEHAGDHDRPSRVVGKIPQELVNELDDLQVERRVLETRIEHEIKRATATVLKKYQPDQETLDDRHDDLWNRVYKAAGVSENTKGRYSVDRITGELIEYLEKNPFHH